MTNTVVLWMGPGRRRAMDYPLAMQNRKTSLRLSGAAITGSGSTGQEDRWSDVDLAFGIAEADELSEVLADWTAYMYRRHLALHHVDVTMGAWLYRVFLLPSTLQIDLAFAPAAEFRPLASTFRLVFGKANEPRRFPTP